MTQRRALLLACACAAAVPALLVFWLGKDAASRSGARAHSSATPPAGGGERSSTPLRGGLDEVLAKFRRNAGSDADLSALRHALFADPAAGLAAIVQFLATGEDAATGQSLAIGPGGELSGAPTLRLFLLDLLGQLARLTGTGESAEFARQLLAKKESPDEWALALRNVAWAEPNSRAYLAERLHEMLAYEPWRATPTPGFLEAFDVAVYSGDATFVPTFAALARGPDPTLQRAATIALDRLAEASPLAVMEFLNAHPTEIADRPLIRADYFAKANLADTAQRNAVEQYLARDDVSLAEKTKMLHALASPGSFVADSLLATSAAPDDGTARYAAIAKVTSEWLQTGGPFPALRPEIVWLNGRVTSGE